MELEIAPILIILSMFLFPLWKIFGNFRRSRRISSANWPPPGPLKLPVIGNLHNLAGSPPHHALRNLARKHGPIIRLQLGEIPLVVISTPRVAKEILKTHDLAFASRPKFLSRGIITYDYQDIAFAEYGSYWRQMRKICSLELLSSKRIHSFSSIREEEASSIINSIRESLHSPVDLTQTISLYTNSVVCRAAFGKRPGNQEELIPLLHELTSSASGFHVAYLFPSLKFLQVITSLVSRLEHIHQKIDKVFDIIIDEHKEKIASKENKLGESVVEDLVDAFLQLEEKDDLEFPVTMESIKAVIVDIFLAGTDTSSTAIEFAIVEMIRHPRVMKKAQDEVRRLFKGKDKVQQADLDGLNYLKLVIRETLRLHPPLPLLLPRESRQQQEIDGYEIPAKTKIVLNAMAINRDPGHWENSECFEPERFADSGIEFIGMNFEYIPFGGGRRMCPGISFALASIEMLLAQLLYHFDWKLPNEMKPEDLDMTEILGITARRKSKLHLIASPHTALG